MMLNWTMKREPSWMHRYIEALELELTGAAAELTTSRDGPNGNVTLFPDAACQSMIVGDVPTLHPSPK